MSYLRTLEFIVWLSLAIIAYGYLVYPLLIWLLSKLFGESEQPGAQAALPSLSIIIVACDEQDVMAARIENALLTEYPKGLLEIVIASDGSTDATEAILLASEARGIKPSISHVRRGKTATLNDLVPRLRGDIVFFSDANTCADPGAAERLARYFADQRIGAVCGRLVLRDTDKSGNTDGVYWKYETFLKRCESRLGALLGANGAIYAIRRSLFPLFPDTTVIDDFSIPLLIRMKTGARIVYASDAVAFEQTAIDVHSEFSRRARIGAGGVQAMRLLYPLLNPRCGWIAFSLFSHKIVRWLCPWCLAAMFIASDLLALSHRYETVFFLQIIFYCGSLLSLVLPMHWRFLRPLRLAQMFTAMNAALMVGFWRYALVGATGTWQRTARSES